MKKKRSSRRRKIGGVLRSFLKTAKKGLQAYGGKRK